MRVKDGRSERGRLSCSEWNDGVIEKGTAKSSTGSQNKVKSVLENERQRG